MDDLKKSLIIDGCAATEDRDSQDEVLEIDGADISPLKSGAAFVNSDHRSGFQNLIGRVIDAKKISKVEDCELPSQTRIWNEKRKPFIWARMELFDGHGHKEADSLASLYRFYMSKGQEPPIKISVEGKKNHVDRFTGRLKKTTIKGLAITVVPANKQTCTEVVGIMKNAGASDNTVDALVKSEGGVIPSFIETNEHPLETIRQMMMVATRYLEAARAARKK
jgi:hypothetical protein